MLAAVALLALGAAACNGDTIVQGPGGVNGINVNANGSATGTPDVAVLQLGVEVEAPTVEAVRDAAATAQTAVIDSLKSNGVTDPDIQTQQFSINPQYDVAGSQPVAPGAISPPVAPGRQVIRGYRVSNLIVVKVKDLSKVSKTLDDATRAGGNSTIVRGISFTIDDPEELMAQAREEAVEKARAQAETLARLSNVSLGKLISISESGGPQPLPYLNAPRTGSATQADTPIQPGELQVVVNVNALWAIE